MQWRLRIASLACAAALVSGSAAGDVVDQSASGFTLRSTAQIAAAPDRVFRALVDVGSWWSKDHTYTGDATNMSIVAQPGGCFCEESPEGLGVEHGRVVNVAPNSLLRIATALGPLQELGVSGSMTWQIAPSGQGSIVTMTYAVGGYASGGLDKLAGPVDKVLAQQVALLKAHIEKLPK